jgi:hypothetical protein
VIIANYELIKQKIDTHYASKLVHTNGYLTVFVTYKLFLFISRTKLMEVVLLKYLFHLVTLTQTVDLLHTMFPCVLMWLIFSINVGSYNIGFVSGY